MKVKDVMHKGVDWVSPETPITEIAKLMQAHDVGCIPIGENDHLVGMVTDRDIDCCRDDDDLAKAVHHMEALKIRRLPVINKSKRMVGMISLGDVGHSAGADLLTQCVKSV